MTTAPAHSPIGASGYSRWKHCPGSVRLIQTMPHMSSEFADEGTEAHDLACRILMAIKKGKPRPDTFGYEDEMVDYVDMYVDHILSLQRPGCIQLYEHRFHLKEVHELCFGTADGVTYYPDKKLLIISDLKYGAGVYVDVTRNEQLMYYALGAVLSLGWCVHKIRIEIIQPRIRHAEAVRPWDCDIFDLWEFQEQLRLDALATEDPDAPLCAGDWCLFCPVAPVCPLLDLKAKVIMARDARGEQDLDPERLAADLKWIDLLEMLARRKREYAYKLAESGKKVPGWKLVPKNGKRDWKDEEEAGTTMRFSGLTAEEIHTTPKPVELKSPNQIETTVPVGPDKLFKTKKELKDYVAALTTTKSSGHKLVPESADGEEVKIATAQSVFSARRKEIAELT